MKWLVKAIKTWVSQASIAGQFDFERTPTKSSAMVVQIAFHRRWSKKNWNFLPVQNCCLLICDNWLQHVTILSLKNKKCNINYLQSLLGPKENGYFNISTEKSNISWYFFLIPLFHLCSTGSRGDRLGARFTGPNGRRRCWLNLTIDDIHTFK